MNEAATRLRALGRLTEALQPMRAGLEMAVQQKDWKNAAICAGNLSELEVMLGRLPDAVTDARQSITHADQSGDAFQRMVKRSTAADALHQSGQRAEAGTLFAEAERMQQESQPQFDLLYSAAGFRYCDWLLAPAEQAAWQDLFDQPLSRSKPQVSDGLAEVERRATTTLVWDTPLSWLLDIALDHLTLARVGLIRAILEKFPRTAAEARPAARRRRRQRPPRRRNDGSASPWPAHRRALSLRPRRARLALKHLAEAQQIAERGPMPLFLADMHLHRARMFRDKAELAKAATLIRDCGYGRRYDELTDAEEALGKV